ncbi:MAG: hypothetical protein LUP97_06065 [Methanoregula sp.]|nr:hypothetical protein [Methanoregula sp.]
MKLPDHFFRYFFIAAILLVSGIALIIIQTDGTNPGLVPLDHAALQARADYHKTTVMPFMAAAFPRLLLLNAGVALFILIVPLFWVWVWWFRRDILDTMITLMQGTVSLLMLALGHNSFPKLYVTCKTLSWQMVVTMYLPHGVLEMLAFVLAGTSAFLCIDALKVYLLENGNSHTLHHGDLCLFILGRTWKAGFVIFFLMAIAAAIECWVTPVLVESAFEAALPGVA